jgi:uncharacterized membrane protein YqjE
MALDAVRNSALTRTVVDLIGDFSQLVQKEIQLARVEVTEKVTTALQAGVWMAIACATGFLAAILLVEGAVFALVDFGFAIHWACLGMAVLLLLFAGIFFAYGRSGMRQNFTPQRTLTHIAADARTIKEKLT